MATERTTLRRSGHSCLLCGEGTPQLKFATSFGIMIIIIIVSSKEKGRRHLVEIICSCWDL